MVVAQDPLGTYLVRVSGGRKRIGRIVETEAYAGPHDLASHSSIGLTERNRVMFGSQGHAYVHMIHGMHFCLNVVTEPAQDARSAARVLGNINVIAAWDEQGPEDRQVDPYLRRPVGAPGRGPTADPGSTESARLSRSRAP